jgi:hypothetical protein
MQMSMNCSCTTGARSIGLCHNSEAGMKHQSIIHWEIEDESVARVEQTGGLAKCLATRSQCSFHNGHRAAHPSSCGVAGTSKDTSRMRATTYQTCADKTFLSLNASIACHLNSLQTTGITVRRSTDCFSSSTFCCKLSQKG